MIKETVACLICKAPLPYLKRVQKERFCGGPCHGKYATLPAHQLCVSCGRPLLPHEFGGRACDSHECRKVAELQRLEQERLQREALKGRVREIRDRESALAGIEEPETYWPAVIPANRSRVTNLPDRRRRAFRDHVNRLIGEAGAGLAAPSASEAGSPAPPAPSVSPTPEVQAVLNRACALCRGFCCGKGNNHAYLTAETIRRYMGQHPDRRPRDVLASYMGRVGNKTYENSCVFHGADGCRLPREMRSDVCNRYFCPDLKEFQQDLAGRDPARGFFAAMIKDEIQVAAFCDGDRTSAVPPTPATDRGL